MLNRAIRDQILSDLEQLTPAEQQRAVELVRSVRMPLKGASIADLEGLTGSLDDQSAAQMMRAIEEDCERVDVAGW